MDCVVYHVGWRSNDDIFHNMGPQVRGGRGLYPHNGWAVGEFGRREFSTEPPKSHSLSQTERSIINNGWLLRRFSGWLTRGLSSKRGIWPVEISTRGSLNRRKTKLVGEQVVHYLQKVQRCAKCVCYIEQASDRATLLGLSAPTGVKKRIACIWQPRQPAGPLQVEVETAE